MAVALAGTLADARDAFLRAHAEALYAELTDRLSRALRLDELLRAIAGRVPGLTPNDDELAAEHARTLPDQEGIEIAQGQVLAHVLSSLAAGGHLVWAMLRPTADALELLDAFVAAGEVDLGGAHVRRSGRAAVVELRNPRHLNAEDDQTLAATEVAVDLALLDPQVEVGVFRGGVVEHERTPGSGSFGAGLNDAPVQGQDPGAVLHRPRHGLRQQALSWAERGSFRPGEPEATIEKPWIAAVETYAIGGACQLLHVMDHVIAQRGARLFLPARARGSSPALRTSAWRGRSGTGGAPGDPVGDGVRGRRGQRRPAVR